MDKKSRPAPFLAIYFLVGLIAGAAGIGVLWVLGLESNTSILLTSWLLSFIVILSGYYANRWSFSKTPKMFYFVLFGGMAFRVLVVVVLVVWAYQGGWPPMVPFLTTLAIYYFVFQTMEIVLIRRQLTK